MICYRDMCFCSYYRKCANQTTCRRCLTSEVVKQAEKTGLPIDQFIEKPDCFEKYWEEK